MDHGKQIIRLINQIEKLIQGLSLQQAQNNMENYTLTNRRDSQNRQQKARNIKKYLENRVMPILSPMQIAILKEKPHDLRQFCKQYLRQARHSQLNPSGSKDPDGEDIPDHIFRQQVRQKIRKQRKGSRQAIIGDRPKQGFLTVGQLALSSPAIEYPQQVTVKLIVHLKRCVFFEHLSTKQLVKLIQRMNTVQFQAGEVIIRQGQSGNQLYVVESGMLKCQKEQNKQVLKYYSSGQIFGELSLLYNNPRASTVTGIQPGKLFSLSRTYFSAILHLGMIEKLKECQQLVQNIDIFDTLNIYEKTKLYESMQLKTVGPQKYIIREGEQGTCFYIVAEGQLVAYKQRQNENKLVYAYKKGDYFGQIALLRNLPRQASVKTITDVRLYFINTESFSRVLGSLQSILRRNQERYTRWASQLSK